MTKQTITLTFCDQAENHVGMQKIGAMSSHGFNLDHLTQAREWFDERNIKTELIDLSNYDSDAYILVAKRGVDAVLDEYTSEEFFDEQRNLDWDSKAFMYGRVVNKHARHNLCYGLVEQEPDYEAGKGKIVSFDNVPILKLFRKNIQKFIGSTGKNLVVEGNNYYDVTKCGIGFHGDSERKKVIGVRLGTSMCLVFQWYFNGERKGEPTRINLSGGDVYIMSEKATGNDWKRKSIYTLRHAAGCDKYTIAK